METWTDQAIYRTDQRVTLSMWIKANSNPDLAQIENTTLLITLKQPFGQFITLSTQNKVTLAKGREWTVNLFSLPINTEAFRNLGAYQTHTQLLDDRGQVFCESFTNFEIRTAFGLQKDLFAPGAHEKTTTLIVTSRRTELTDPFASILAVWLDAAYQTTTQVLYQEGLSQSYHTGDLNPFDVVIYYGLDFDQPPPSEFIADVFSEKARGKKIVWLGYHLDSVISETSAFYGFRFDRLSSGNSATTLEYLDTDSRYTLLNPDLSFGVVQDPGLARVRATVAEKDSPNNLIISATHVDRPEEGESFYFFGFHPTANLLNFGAHLVFLDLLNEVYGIDRGKTALVRLEDISANTREEDLLGITGYLRDQGVPFTLALIPIFATGDTVVSRLSEDQQFRRMVKNALLDGGEFVLHGATHQFDGVTGIDFEFWDEVRDTPVGDEAFVRQRVADGLIEISFSGLESQLVGWETPHYKAAPDAYEVFEELFSLIYEPNPWGYNLDLVPYATERTNTVYVPTPLGFIPADHAQQALQTMLGYIEKLDGLQYGALASFFYHPFLGLDNLKVIVETLQQRGWTFKLASSFSP